MSDVDDSFVQRYRALYDKKRRAMMAEIGARQLAAECCDPALVPYFRAELLGEEPPPDAPQPWAIPMTTEEQQP